MYWRHLLILMCFVINHVHSAKILVLIPTPSISHQIPFKPFTEALVKRGHHVTLLTPNPVKYESDEYKNLTQIDVGSISYEIYNRNINFVKIKKNLWLPASAYNTFFDTVLQYSDAQLSTDEMQKLLRDPDEKFDLCIVEMFCPPMLAFKDRFNCSLIVVSSSNALLNTLDAVGNPSNPILYPYFLNPYSKPYTFIQKLNLVISDLYYRYIYYCKYLPRFNELAKKHFGKNTRSIQDLEKDIDMFFLNIIPMFGDIRPSVPAIVHMNGLHLKANNPLPSMVLDKAINGAIYFSLGSNVKSVDLPLSVRRKFLDAFEELPYIILWKWENDTMEDKPPNVIVSKWMPQQDVLAHPNIKAFITQGGRQSMEEAIHHKIPMIGLPFISDQFFNIKKLIQFNIGVELFHETLSKESILNSINEVVSNQKYKEQISKLSNIINDQPQSALERIVWWTEYVIRHKGASHLRSPSIGVPFYEYFLLDIISFVLLCAILFIIILLIISKNIYRIITNIIRIKTVHLKKQ